nr:MAG TPA: hypothetical protein [Caudoviricetes sp.]
MRPAAGRTEKTPPVRRSASQSRLPERQYRTAGYRAHRSQAPPGQSRRK